MSRLLAAALAPLLAACAATAASEAADPAGSAEAFAFEDSEEIDGGQRSFTYAWPAAVAAIPKLAAELDADRRQRLADQQELWAESLRDCPEEAASCRNLSLGLGWHVVADLPGYLSLSNSFDAYTGGAHGIYGRGSLLWEKDPGRSLEPKEVFISEAALESALAERACRQLNRERAKRRGEAIPEGATEWPDNCPGIEEIVVFLGSKGKTAFDRIGLYYGPYVAGSYAEGDYEITLPVDAALLAAVRPEFREVFALAR